MGKSSSQAPAPDPNIGKAALKQAETGEEWLGFAKDAFAVSSDRQKELDALTKEVAHRQLGLAEDQQAFVKSITDKQIGLAQDQQDLAERTSERQLELAENQQDYVRDVTDRQFGLAEKQQDLAERVTDQQLDQADWQFGIAKKDRQRYEDTFQPVEDQFVEEATNYATPEKQAEAAAEASADVQASAAAQRQASQRQAASMGINPASGRFAGIDRSAELGTALADAGAKNTARRAVRDKGLALKADVANLGRGLPAQSASAAAAGLNASNSAIAGSGAAAGLGINTGNSAISNMGGAAQLGINANNLGLSGNAAATGLGINTGNSAIANMGGAAQLGINAYGLGLGGAQAANAQYLASTDLMGSGFKGAMAGYGGQAQTLNNQYANDINAWEAQQKVNAANASGLGSFLGGALGLMLSDEDAKTDKEEIPEGKALDAIEKLPVEEWTYKPGAADEGRHVGPYAQDFQEATGKGDGHTIPAQDAIGLTMKAVQDLDHKVDRIATVVGLGDAAGGRKTKKTPQKKMAKPERIAA